MPRQYLIKGRVVLANTAEEGKEEAKLSSSFQKARQRQGKTMPEYREPMLYCT